MIEAGLGWKFRDHVADRILFEDQVAEHMFTGHLARRRIYPARLYQDDVALGAIKNQLKCSARIEHPGFQRVFLAGDTAGCFTVIGEHNDAPPITIAAERKTYSKPRDWHDFALRFSRFCLEMQRLHIALDRINLDDLVFHRTLFQIPSRFPVGIIDEATVLASPYLQRLMESGVGGSYIVDKGQYPVTQSISKVKDILFTLASGQTARDVQQMIEYRSESARVTGSKQFSALGLEPVVESLLLRLHAASDQPSITSFQALASALEMLTPDDLSGSAQQAGIPNSGFVSASSGRPATSAASSATPAQTPATAAPASPSAASPRTTQSPRAESPASGSGLSDISMAGRERLNEDVEEDRSYLYPQRSSSTSAAPKPTPEKEVPADKQSGSGSGLYSPTASSASIKRPRAGGGGGALKVILLVIVLAVLGGGGWVAWTNLGEPPQNTAPQAVFTEIPGIKGVNEPIELDATSSSDADGQTLRYTWTVRRVNEDGTPGSALGISDHILEPNGTEAASRATLTILQSGQYQIELKVFDGLSNSQTVTKSIAITN